MNDLSELLTGQVNQHGDRIAVATSDLATVISYRQLDTFVRSTAWSIPGQELKVATSRI